MRELQLSGIHRSLGANMDSFAGWEMPIRYDRITYEHVAVRERVGLFDISHMGIIEVEGTGGSELLQFVTSNDISKLATGAAQYSTVLNGKGGVKDDLFVYRTANRKFMIVTNAINGEKIHGWLTGHANGDVEVRNVTTDTVMFALQGPKAQRVLQKMTESDLDKIDRFEAKWTELIGVRSLVSRSGYTGGDGFEIYIFDQTVKNVGDAIEVWNGLLKMGEEDGIKPCGLGARDSLRLEEGLPLYGHELTEEITPLEARIDYAVAFDKGDFVGRDPLLEQREEGISRKRIGIKMEERGIPRGECDLFMGEDKIGVVTSGGFSPLLGIGIGMGYAPPELEVGEEINVSIRKQRRRAVVVEWPFHRREENG